VPRGAFHWKIDRTTSSRELPLCPNHAVAVAGEDAMKRHLATCAEWLGGEFYLASDEVIEAAWQLACRATQGQNGISRIERPKISDPTGKRLT
jgi:hypothetical protein